MIGRRIASLVPATVLAALACAPITVPAPVPQPYARPVALAGAEPIPVAIALDLTSLRAGELPGESPFSAKGKQIIGKALAENAERVARAAFSDVTTSDVPVEGRAMLRPRVATYEVGIGGAGYTPNLYTMVLEWSVLDASGDLVWIETVSHTSSKTRTTVEMVLRASHAALVGSRELRAFAAATP